MNAAFLLLFVMSFSIIESANILVMLPLPLYSHTIAYMPIIKELAKRGHKITMVSPFPQEKKNPNIIDITVPPLYEEITDPSMYVLAKKNPLENLKEFWDFGLRGADAAFSQDAVKKIFSLPSNSFDLIMTETFFLLESMTALQYKFKCPVVNLHPWSLTVPIAYYTGNPLLSSVIPSVYSSSHTDDMSFLQRANNVIIDLMELAGYNFYYLPRQDKIMRKHLENLEGFENLPYITELLRNTSLSLIDAHHAIDFKKPYFKNVVEIGGLTIQNKQQVSKELQQFMDNSKQGFVYFSLGSHLPSSMLPESFKENLFKAFGKIKENVIMKWDNPQEEKPKNIRIEKWLPQVEILGHPNCKLFITHGGLHAVQEATFFGVPMIGVPLVADQPINVRYVEHSGIGLSIDVFETTEELFVNSIHTVLNDKKYKEAVVAKSSMLKDNPINTLDNAVNYVEYLLRHNVQHMQPPLLNRTWYELLLLDIWMLLAVTLLLIVISILALVRMIMLIFKITKKGGKKSKTH